jgi:hypothetical protein
VSTHSKTPDAPGASPTTAFSHHELADQAIALDVPTFPCTDDKKPLTRRGFHDVTRDPVAIRRMFAHPAAAMIGVPTGPASGLVVVDVDTKDDKPGLDWLEQHSVALPFTRTHRTVSGGIHLLFAFPDDAAVGSSQSRIAPGVDVRGAGGYAIVPPSPGYSVVMDWPVAEMPAWLVEANQRPPEPAPAPLVRRQPPKDATAAGVQRLLSLIEFVATTPEGERNGRLFWAACRAAEAAADGEMPAEEAASALEQAAYAAGLRGPEVRRTIISGFRSTSGGRVAA